MPYISEARRPLFRYPIIRMMEKLENGADLNYCFSMLCKEFIEKFGESYSNYAECIAALEGAKLELYRRQIASYEDKKIVENGDL